MVKCQNCGEEAIEGAKFCRNCGAELIQEKTVETEQTKFCTNCGFKFDKPIKFCPECGTPASGEPQTAKVMWFQVRTRVQVLRQYCHFL